MTTKVAWKGSFWLYGMDVYCFHLDDGTKTIDVDSAMAMCALAADGKGVGDDAQIDEFRAWYMGLH